MSQIHLVDISLEKVIEKSSCILVAKKSEPFVTEEKINIAPFWKRIFGKKYPPFINLTYHFDLIDILYSEKKLFDSKTIKVAPADQVNHFAMHSCYYFDQLVPSVEMGSYKTSIDLDKADKLILFLNVSKHNAFTFTVVSAYESVGKLEEITKIINKKKK